VKAERKRFRALRLIHFLYRPEPRQPWEPAGEVSVSEIFRRSLLIAVCIAIFVWGVYTEISKNYSFNWRLIIKYLPDFLEGFKVTLQVSVLALIFSLILGLVVGLGRVSRRVLFSDLALVYVETIRNIPLLVIILLMYFGFGSVFDMSRYTASVLALTVFQSAYIAEIIRGGIESVDKGQIWAARSLGVTERATMRHIILPQVTRRITPSIAGQIIYLIQGSSLCSVISLAELTLTARRILTVTYASMESYITLMMFYFVICFTLSIGTKILESRLDVG
jgi:polar amino acid transport system permease protein